MCLQINSCHLIKDGEPVPRIDNRPIEVYKVLRVPDFLTGPYTTPNRGIPIKFGDCHTCIQRAKLQVKRSYGAFFVDKGIHAWRTKSAAQDFIRYRPGYTTVDYVMFKSIIPAGVKYFLGEDGDIVSEKLIIKK
jgi:hypothetical protein